MSQGLVNVLLASDASHTPDGVNIREDHVVILDDVDTYSGVDGATVWLDGKGYLIGELLEFYLAMTVDADEEEDDGQTYSDPTPDVNPHCEPCGTSKRWCGCT